jgi:hypothetical protein
LQYQHNAVYRRLCEARRIAPEAISAWHEIPAVHTSAFKECELTSLPPHERTTVFWSSGTTGEKRSRHFHSSESLALYEESLRPWFERHMLGYASDGDDAERLNPLPLVALTPPPQAAPNSSLVHMFATVQRTFGARDSLFCGCVGMNGTWALDMDAALFAIRKSMCANRPLILLGTAFNFVHLLDRFASGNMRYQLARGSRVMETGGYKGQSREVPRSELHASITKHLGIPGEYIITEYGMSELSSQAYDGVAGGMPEESRADLTVPSGAPSPRQFHFPPWARTLVISPETGREVSEGETGLLRIFDLANVFSVMAIQTDDLAIRRSHGFELMGRARQAEPRGCSLMSPSASA